MANQDYKELMGISENIIVMPDEPDANVDTAPNGASDNDETPSRQRRCNDDSGRTARPEPLKV